MLHGSSGHPPWHQVVATLVLECPGFDQWREIIWTLPDRTCEEEHVDVYQSLRQQLMQRLAHIEGRLDTVEKDRRRGTNTLDPD